MPQSAYTTLFTSVYDSIPSYLSEVVKHIDDERERDIILLETITALSAMFTMQTAIMTRNVTGCICTLFHRILAILKRLPANFSFAQFAEQAACFDMKRRAIQKLLKKCIGVYISKVSHGMYKKK